MLIERIVISGQPVFLLAIVGLAAPQAAAAQVEGQRGPAPVAVFDSLWSAFERSYALFEDKRISWETVRPVYRRRVAGVETDRELFDVLADMLKLLNDNHVKLTGWDTYLSNGGSLQGRRMRDLSPELVFERYLRDEVELRVDGLIVFGWLADSVGYLRISGMDDVRATTTAMDEVVGTFADARGVIVDIRGNLGGDDPVGRAIASRFADRSRVYMTTRLKSGPGPDDFTAPLPWSMIPPRTGGLVVPTVVLAHTFTMSAAENFLLAIRRLPHVTVVGSPTAGAMGETYNDVLPNGWTYRTVRSRTLDAEGRSFEGVGIPPDLWIENTPEDIEAGRDRVLEFALDLVIAEETPRRDRVAGEIETQVRPVPLPLADSLAAWIEAHGPEPAMERYDRALEDPDRWFLAEDFAYDEDLTSLGRRLLDEGSLDAAIRVLEAASDAYPESYRPHRWLVAAYERAGLAEESERARIRALELNPRLYHDDRRAVLELEGRIPLAHRFLDTLFDRSAEEAIREYRDLLRRQPQRAHVDPLLLVQGGQQLREAGVLDEAGTVFEFVVEEFPSWPPGHRGLAETKRMAGDDY